MSYSSELKELKRRRNEQRIFASDVLDDNSPFMTEFAKKINASRSQTFLQIYDQKIDQLEPMVEKQLKEEMVNTVIRTVEKQNSYVSGELGKSLEQALKSLNFH